MANMHAHSRSRASSRRAAASSVDLPYYRCFCFACCGRKETIGLDCARKIWLAQGGNVRVFSFIKAYLSSRLSIGHLPSSLNLRLAAAVDSARSRRTPMLCDNKVNIANQMGILPSKISKLRCNTRPITLSKPYIEQRTNEEHDACPKLNRSATITRIMALGK